MKLFGIKNLPLTYVFLAVIALAIPLTLVLTSQEQDIRQEAATGRNQKSSSNTPTIVTCNDNVTKVTLEDDCGPKNENKFRKMSFICANGYTQDMGGATEKQQTCRTAGDWLSRANQICRDVTPSCRSLTPTPTLTPTPIPCNTVRGDGYSLGEACTGGRWKSIIDYKCTDGFVGGPVQSDGGSCMPSTEWNRKVGELCRQRESCYEAPPATPTLTPTPTACIPVTLASGSGPENRCEISGYRNYTVVCTDGYSEPLTDTRQTERCYSLSDWQPIARNKCLRRSAC